MELAGQLRRLAAGTSAHALSAGEAERLFGAMLDGAVPPLELGAALAALRRKRESSAELTGFARALAARTLPVHLPPGAPRCAVIPSYAGVAHPASLMPLLALMLARHGVPVLIHGHLGAPRPPSLAVLHELGVMPSTSLAAAQSELAGRGLAVLATELLAPGLDSLLALRERLPWRSSAHLAAKLLDPCPGRSVRMVCTADSDLVDTMRQALRELSADALLMRTPGDEASANPMRRPRIEHFRQGQGEVLFEAEIASTAPAWPAPNPGDPRAMAEWIVAVLDGRRAAPQPLLNQLAACLCACGRTPDLHRAKATVALGLSTQLRLPPVRPALSGLGAS
jgi:anthranilate phosphoribosyltransferase